MIWLKEIRKEMQLTQVKVAEKAGIDRAYYGMIELGIRRPSPEVAKKIAGADQYIAGFRVLRGSSTESPKRRGWNPVTSSGSSTRMSIRDTVFL